MNMQKVKENNRGVTLIALVITIIVLLILAGISIASLSGDNGVLNRASESKVTNDVATIKEQVEWVRQDLIIQSKIDGKNPSVQVFIEAIKAELKTTTSDASSVTTSDDLYKVNVEEDLVYSVEILNKK